MFNAILCFNGANGETDLVIEKFKKHLSLVCEL